MAELEFAFLAEYVRLDAGGTWSALGAGFTTIWAAALPAQQIFSVAGRILLDPGEEGSADVQITIAGPDEAFRIVSQALVTPRGGPPFDTDEDGRIPLTFASAGALALPSLGLYTILVQVGEAPPRKLTFEVKWAESEVSQEP
jgi:hypothetical protein